MNSARVKLFIIFMALVSVSASVQDCREDNICLQNVLKVL